jgi:uncharacterized protein DUF4410
VRHRARWWSIVAVVVLALGGCAETAPRPASDGVAYRDDPELQKVWIADGFTFQGYDVLLVQETRTDVRNLNPDGAENLAWARGALRDEIVTALRAKNAFPSVVVAAGDVKGARVLRLETTIVEYEKGGGGARYFAGLYGAGQPVIRVRGRLTDAERLVFAFEARRSGDSGLSRMFGGYRSDRAIQEEDIRDLAVDLADFIARSGPRR